MRFRVLTLAVVWGLHAVPLVADAQPAPKVRVGVGDPVEAGFADSLSRPGRNPTGLTLNSPELSAKRLELLTETVPGLTRLAVLSNPANLAATPQLKEVQKYCAGP